MQFVIILKDQGMDDIHFTNICMCMEIEKPIAIYFVL